MKFVDEYRDPALVRALASRIAKNATSPMTLMEVCGSHTMAIQRFGLPALLPDTIRLISGPGCPVCVTEIGYVDHACAIARQDGVIITTFGDLIRVPGSESSLQQERAEGADIRIVQSSLEALNLARAHPDRTVVFLGIGFETTAPTTAAAIAEADEHRVANFQVLCAHKLMKPAMLALVAEGVAIDGYICPGHVSIVTGARMYEEIVTACSIGCVVSGFEPLDILNAIDRLVTQIINKAPAVENAYPRAVTWEGATAAWTMLERVFEPCDAVWRGLGSIPGSGLAIREAYRAHDASATFSLDLPEPVEPAGCRCGEILKGTIQPSDCPLFGQACTPETPVGACMVSSEGTCAAHYRYGS